MTQHEWFCQACEMPISACILTLSAFTLSIEATRWIYFHACDKMAFHCAG